MEVDPIDHEENTAVEKKDETENHLSEEIEKEDVDMVGVEESSLSSCSLDEEDDPVVKEIEVYINRVEDADIFSLQYPLRPIYRPYGDQGQLVRAELRSKQKTLRFTYNLNSEGDNFDPGRRFDDNGEIVTIPHVLKSTSAVEPNCSYGVGILKNGRLYVTPVRQVVQFRPDFSHVDREAEATTQRSSQHVAETKKGPTESPSPSTKQEETPGADASPSSFSQFTGALKDATEGRQRVLQSKIRNIMESEPWIPIDTLYQSDAPEAYEILDLLCSFSIDKVEEEETKEEVKEEVNLGGMFGIAEETVGAEKPSQPKRRVSGGPQVPIIQFYPQVEPYLDNLCSFGGATQTDSSGALSYLSLSKLAIDQQVLQILKHRHIETFSRIKSLCTRKLPDVELIKLLKSFGVLFQGNWVIKAHYVYDGYEALCRDLLLILLLFGKNTSGVQRESFAKQTKLPLSIVTEMFSQILELKGTEWQCKVQPDKEFTTTFPQEDRLAQSFWKERMTSIREEMKAGIQQQEKRLAAAANRTATVSKVGATAPGEKIATVDTSKLTRLVGEVLKARGAQPLATITEEVRKKAEVAGSMVGSFETSDVQNVLTTTAIEIGGLWVAKKLGNARLDSYRDVLISLFRRSPKPLTTDQIRLEFKSQLKKTDDLPDVVVRQLLREFSSNQSGLWVFRGASTSSS